MAARLVRDGFFPPERLETLRLLANALPIQSRLRASVEGEYPGAEMILCFDWLEERVAFRVGAGLFVQHYAHYNVVRLQELLIRRTLEMVYRRPAPPESGALRDPDGEAAISSALHSRCRPRPRRW